MSLFLYRMKLDLNVLVTQSDRKIAIISLIIEYDLYITYLLMREERNTYARYFMV